MWDACIMAGVQSMGLWQASDMPWVGMLLKGEAMGEGGSNSAPPGLANEDSMGKSGNCGGQNCGMWSISAGSVSGDGPGGPCGMPTDADYGHSYGLFQDTPGCEGTFLQTLPSGYSETHTTTADYIKWSQTQVTFYVETQETVGVMDVLGNTMKGDINGVMVSSDPQYKLSIFNPAYYFFVHLVFTLKNQYLQVNAGSSSCTEYQRTERAIAYWLNGDIPPGGCALPTGTGQGGDVNYIKQAISYWNAVGSTKFPGPAPM